MRKNSVKSRTAARCAELVCFIKTSAGWPAYGPTYTEMAAYMGCSTRSIRWYLDLIERDGEIARKPGAWRGIHARAGHERS